MLKTMGTARLSGRPLRVNAPRDGGVGIAVLVLSFDDLNSTATVSPTPSSSFHAQPPVCCMLSREIRAVVSRSLGAAQQ